MQAPRRIAVAGATGKVGRQVVDVLTERGHDVGAMARATGVDVATGDGLAEALRGVECVIDTASGPTDQHGATEFFTAAARNLHAAGEQAGVRRMVVVSTIGCDRFTAGYMAAKHAHEQAMLAGPIPVRILRAEIFHEMVAQFVEWGRQGDVSYVMKGRTRPVAARTVAEALADLALDPDWAAAQGSAGPPVSEIVGPREEDLVEIARLLAARRGDPVRIEGVTDPSDPDRDLLESGALLHGPDAIHAGPTFQDWLAASSHDVSEPVTPINAFTVPPDEAERFQERWTETARILARILAGQPGFIRARLYRSLSDDAEPRFINVSEWDSGNALDAAQANPEWHATVQRFMDDPDLHVTARPAVYQVAVDVRPGDPL